MPSWLHKPKKPSSSAVRMATLNTPRQPQQQQPQQQSVPHPDGDMPSDTGGATGKAGDPSNIELALCGMIAALQSWQRLEPSLKHQQQNLIRQVSLTEESTAAVRQHSQNLANQQDSRRQLLYQRTFNSPECREAIRNLREYLEHAAAVAAGQEHGTTAVHSACTVTSDCIEHSVTSASWRRELRHRLRRQRQRQLLCPKHGDPNRLEKQSRQPVFCSSTPTEADLATWLTSEAVQESEYSGACSCCRRTVQKCVLSSANCGQVPSVRYHLPALEAPIPESGVEKVKQLPVAHLSGWGRGDFKVLAYDCSLHCCQSGTVVLTGPERLFPPAAIVANFLLPSLEVHDLNLLMRASSFGEALRRRCEDTDSSEDDDSEDTEAVGGDAEEDEEEEERMETRVCGSQDFNGNAVKDQDVASCDCVDSLETTTCDSGKRLDETALSAMGNNSNTLPIVLHTTHPLQLPPQTPAPPSALPISASSGTADLGSAPLRMPAEATESEISDNLVAAICEKGAALLPTKSEAFLQLGVPTALPSPTKIETSPHRTQEAPCLAVTLEQGADGGVDDETAGAKVNRVRAGGQQRQTSRSGRSATTLDVLDHVTSMESGEKSVAGDSFSSGGAGGCSVVGSGDFDIQVSPQPQPFFRLIETLGRAQRRMECRRLPQLPLPALTPSPRDRSTSPLTVAGDEQQQQTQQRQASLYPQVSHRQRANVHSLNQMLMQSPFTPCRSLSQQQQKQHQQQQHQFQNQHQQPKYLFDLQTQNQRQSRQAVRDCLNCQAPPQLQFHHDPCHHPQQLRRTSMFPAALSDHVQLPSVATDVIKKTASSLLTLSQTMQLCVRQIEETVHRLSSAGLSQ